MRKLIAVLTALTRWQSFAAIPAFIALIPAVQADGLDPAIAAACPGFIAWSQQHRAAERKDMQPTVNGTDAALQAQLRSMVAEDQQARQAALVGGLAHPDPIAFNHLLVVDRKNLKTLHEIIAAGGIPSQQRAGSEGIGAFWLLIQHADTDVPLQEQVLKVFSAADSGVPRDDIALLTDRVRGHEGLRQLYGTQFHQSGQQLVPDPIEDEAHVDERRATMDLAPLADYACVLQVVYKMGPPK